MHLIHSNHNVKITIINRELSNKRVLYNEAIIKDSELSVKKELRMRIRELRAELNELIRQQKLL